MKGGNKQQDKTRLAQQNQLKLYLLICLEDDGLDMPSKRQVFMIQ